MTVSRFAFCIAFAVTAMLFAAGCQLKSAAVPANFITVDPSAFVLKSVDRYAESQGDSSQMMIVVIKATYTNQAATQQLISPNKFQLIDPTLMGVYYGQSGGSIYIPQSADAHLDPGKSIDVTLGFRVPASLTTARLTYNE